MSENQDQGVLVTSFGKLNELQLIKSILGSEFNETNLIVKSLSNNSLSSYPFILSNKYYEAKIYFYQTNCLKALKTLIDKIQAVIVYFDNNNEKSYKNFISWSSIIDEIKPEIRLLVCDTATNGSVISKTKILKWCINHEFELIELKPENIEDDQFNDEFEDLNGIERIVQALNAHTWPYMTMKETRNNKPSFQFESIWNKKHEGQEKLTTDQNKNKKNSKSELSLAELNSKIDAIIEDNKIIFETINKDDENSFDLLFQRFQDLKEQAKSLKGEERRIYAEKVTVAFWQAIGGSKEEISDIIN